MPRNDLSENFAHLKKEISIAPSPVLFQTSENVKCSRIGHRRVRAGLIKAMACEVTGHESEAASLRSLRKELRVFAWKKRRSF